MMTPRAYTTLFLLITILHPQPTHTTNRGFNLSMLAAGVISDSIFPAYIPKRLIIYPAFVFHSSIRPKG